MKLEIALLLIVVIGFVSFIIGYAIGTKDTEAIEAYKRLNND